NKKTFFFLIISHTPHLFSDLLFFDPQYESFFAFIIFGDWIDFVTVNFVPSYRFLLYKKE
ncbi:hypothetical protein R0K05_25405, partial [Planococcus sp. SIMBA_160]